MTKLTTTALAFCAFTGVAFAQTAVKAVHTNIPGDPTANVPGLPGVVFGFGDKLSPFGSPYGSPNGNTIFTGHVTSGSTTDQVVLVNGTTVLREGDPSPWGGGTMGSFTEMVGINDAGEFAFICRIAPSYSVQHVVRGSASSYNVVTTGGAAVPALSGATYATSSFGSPVITASGLVGFEADSLVGAGGTNTNNALLLGDGASLVARNGTTIPTGQNGGSSSFAQNFDTNDFRVTHDGAHTLWQGDLDGSSSGDDVVVFDGAVVVQEGAILPGSGFTNPVDSSGIRRVELDSAGNWFAHGDNDVTNLDWIVRNGVVIAAVGQPVTSGSTELWSDQAISACFFAMAGNSHGDVIVGGETDHVDPSRSEVFVFNGADVVLREGDPVDIDGNNVYDDGYTFEDFEDRHIYLSDACELYFVARITNGTTSYRGLFRLEIDCGVTCGPTTQYASGCDGTGGLVPDLDASGCAAANSTFSLDITGGLGGSSAFLFFGLSQNNLPIGGGCSLLLTPLPLSVSVPLPGVGPGNGAISLPTLVPASVTALGLYLQAVIPDAGVSRGFSATNGLSVSFP